MIKPYFKWPGSKSWLANLLNSATYSDFDRIIEPFAGSAAFFLGSSCDTAILGDANEHIALCLTGVRDEPLQVLELLQSLSNSLEVYNLVKNFRPSTAVQAAARMIFLTNTSWGGLYRENRQGIFNVPFGNNKRDFFSEEKIILASAKLQGAEIIHCDYSLTIEKSRKNDLIFIDAPYVTTRPSQHFDRYHSSRYCWDDQLRLAKILTTRKMRNRKILITCAADDDLYALFDGWRISEIPKRNSMTAYKKNSSNRVEALLMSPALSEFGEKILKPSEFKRLNLLI